MIEADDDDALGHVRLVHGCYDLFFDSHVKDRRVLDLDINHGLAVVRPGEDFVQRRDALAVTCVHRLLSIQP